MQSETVAEKTALFSVVVFVLVAPLAAGCSSDHRVSPWGAGGPPPLSAFAAPPDIEEQLAAVETEAGALGLVMSVELRANLPRGGGAVVVRGYEGTDVVGRKRHAVRVATTRGVVLAVGPDEARERATELVPALVQGATGRPGDGAFRSLTDLNGDNTLDVVLKSRTGALEVHRVTPNGSSQYDVDMSLPPMDTTDANADGRIDLVGRAPVDAADPIKPALVEVATFEAGRYSAASKAAKEFHARKARAAARAPEGEAKEDDATRLRRALEHAWHAILSGDPRDPTLEDLRKLPVPAPLRASFDAHVARLRSVAAPRR
jgi:hypothetical protein